MRILAFIAALLFATLPAGAQINPPPIGVSAAGDATGSSSSISLPGLPGRYFIIQSVTVSCAIYAWPTAPILLTVTDGGTVRFQQYVTDFGPFTFDFRDMQTTPASTLNVTWGSCGPNVVGTVNMLYKVY